MTRKKFTPRIIDGQVMEETGLRELRKFMKNIQRVEQIHDDMRKLIEDELPEYAHKLPPREVH